MGPFHHQNWSEPFQLSRLTQVTSSDCFTLNEPVSCTVCYAASIDLLLAYHQATEVLFGFHAVPVCRCTASLLSLPMMRLSFFAP
jgi:hypothetical protein